MTSSANMLCRLFSKVTSAWRVLLKISQNLNWNKDALRKKFCGTRWWACRSLWGHGVRRSNHIINDWEVRVVTMTEPYHGRLKTLNWNWQTHDQANTHQSSAFHSTPDNVATKCVLSCTSWETVLERTLTCRCSLWSWRESLTTFSSGLSHPRWPSSWSTRQGAGTLSTPSNQTPWAALSKNLCPIWTLFRAVHNLPPIQD